MSPQSRRGFRYPGAGVICSCKPPSLGAGNQIAVLASRLYNLSNGAISPVSIVTTTLTPHL